MGKFSELYHDNLYFTDFTQKKSFCLKKKILNRFKVTRSNSVKSIFKVIYKNN